MTGVQTCALPICIKEKQKVLGIIVTTDEECRFYFTELNMGKSITSSSSDFVENSKKFLYNFYTKSINLNNILTYTGAEIVDNPNDADIDLSIESLEKDTILNLLVKDE